MVSTEYVLAWTANLQVRLPQGRILAYLAKPRPGTANLKVRGPGGRLP